MLDLAIDGFSVEGEGIGRARGRAVFVPRCIPGEKVRARLLPSSGRRLEAELLEILAPSRDRVEPCCPVFGRCGGCQLLHVDYQAQLSLKAMVLADALRSIARLEAGSLAVAAAKEPLRYRNHGQFPFALDGIRDCLRVLRGALAPGDSGGGLPSPGSEGAGSRAGSAGLGPPDHRNAR